MPVFLLLIPLFSCDRLHLAFWLHPSFSLLEWFVPIQQPLIPLPVLMMMLLLLLPLSLVLPLVLPPLVLPSLVLASLIPPLLPPLVLLLPHVLQVRTLPSLSSPPSRLLLTEAPLWLRI
jgi:hypothetical protein